MLWSVEMAVIKKKHLPLAPLSSGIMLRRAGRAKRATTTKIRLVVLGALACRSLRLPLAHPQNLGWFFL